MPKKFKLNIKNNQIKQALNLESIKEKLDKKKAKEPIVEKKQPKKTRSKQPILDDSESDQLDQISLEQEKPKRRARSKSAFAETAQTNQIEEISEEDSEQTTLIEAPEPEQITHPTIEEPVPNIAKKATEKLGPTGKHIDDLLKKQEKTKAAPLKKEVPQKEASKVEEKQEELDQDNKKKQAKFKDFKDLKPIKRQTSRPFDSRDRHGLRATDDDARWRKKRSQKIRSRDISDELTIRPTHLNVRLPITIKDLAALMKLKSSELISKLFMQGIILTLNDLLDDETVVGLLGQEFGCEITIDTSAEQLLKITDKTIKEEIESVDQSEVQTRPPVVAFMGHVDHGKTSLIDFIRKSKIVDQEAGAITQHIGAFRCQTSVGSITILDTPGHAAFSAMRARGADVTDIVVLVIAGDEGMKQQTEEAIQHAKAAGVSIVVAINKSDKPNFDAETVYRQLSENNLLPEAWGGQTITVNCSAITGEGIESLLEMLALQAEVLELKANVKGRARGTVLESELHKGMGAVATILVQNGTLMQGDALVADEFWGKVKTMHDEHGKELKEAPPSTPVRITGLSGVPEASQEFIVVEDEKAAKEIADARSVQRQKGTFQKAKRISLENIFQKAQEDEKKILNVILRADVQGSLEAVKTALQNIQSDKAEINVIFTGVGEVSESDIQLAEASNAVIIGFHTGIESHSEPLIKQFGIHVSIHDVIYHAIDHVKLLMSGLLDKLAEELEKGKVEVKAIFKASQLGVIAGCQVIEGSIHRNDRIRIKRGGELIWTGTISSLKRDKDDVREVTKGLECGIVLNQFNDVKVGDIIESYEINYKTQEL